jgi:hypothetical protein
MFERAFIGFGVAFLSLFSLPGLAYACITSGSFSVEDIRKADAIFSGRILSYEIVTTSDTDIPTEYGLITVRVEKLVRGDAAGDVQLYWPNSTFALPEDLLITDPALFAVVDPDKESLSWLGSVFPILSSQRTDLRQVFQPPCGGPFMLPFTSSISKNVSQVLAGKPVDIYANLNPAEHLIFRTIPSTRRTENSTKHVALLGAIGVIVSSGSGYLIWRRRRRRKKTPT